MQSSRKEMSLQKFIMNFVQDESAIDVSLPTMGILMSNRYKGVSISTASVGRLSTSDDATEKSDICFVNMQNTIMSGAMAHREVSISVLIPIKGLVTYFHFL